SRRQHVFCGSGYWPLGDRPALALEAPAQLLEMAPDLSLARSLAGFPTKAAAEEVRQLGQTGFGERLEARRQLLRDVSRDDRARVVASEEGFSGEHLEGHAP